MQLPHEGSRDADLGLSFGIKHVGACAFVRSFVIGDSQGIVACPCNREQKVIMICEGGHESQHTNHDL